MPEPTINTSVFLNFSICSKIPFIRYFVKKVLVFGAYDER
jgi:hypothetical protein